MDFLIISKFRSIIDKRTGRVIESRLQEICHDMAYLYNVKDPLTAEAACTAYYSIGKFLCAELKR